MSSGVALRGDVAERVVVRHSDGWRLGPLREFCLLRRRAGLIAGYLRCIRNSVCGKTIQISVGG